MKRLILSICLVLGFVYSANAAIGGYVTRCGREFYYMLSSTPITPEEDTLFSAEHIRFAKKVPMPRDEKQIEAVVEKMRSETEEKFKNEIYRLYNENKDFMWKHYPEQKYTFEEVYNISLHVRCVNVCVDKIDNKITLIIGIYPKIMRLSLKEREVFMGYIYKGVQYDPTMKNITVKKYTRYDD